MASNINMLYLLIIQSINNCLIQSNLYCDPAWSNNCGYFRFTQGVNLYPPQRGTLRVPLDYCFVSDWGPGYVPTATRYSCVNEGGVNILHQFDYVDDHDYCVSGYSGSDSGSFYEQWTDMDCNPTVCDYVSYKKYLPHINNEAYETNAFVINQCICSVYGLYYKAICTSTDYKLFNYSDSNDCSGPYTIVEQSNQYLVVDHCGAPNPTSKPIPTVKPTTTAEPTNQPILHAPNPTVKPTWMSTTNTEPTFSFLTETVSQTETSVAHSPVMQNIGCNYITYLGIPMPMNSCMKWFHSVASVRFECDSFDNSVNKLFWYKGNCNGIPDEVQTFDTIASDVSGFYCDANYENQKCEQAMVQDCDNDGEFKVITNECLYFANNIYVQIECDSIKSSATYSLYNTQYGNCNEKTLMNSSSLEYVWWWQCVTISCNTYAPNTNNKTNQSNISTIYTVGFFIGFLLIVGVIIGGIYYKKKQNSLNQIQQLNEMMDTQNIETNVENNEQVQKTGNIELYEELKHKRTEENTNYSNNSEQQLREQQRRFEQQMELEKRKILQQETERKRKKIKMIRSNLPKVANRALYCCKCGMSWTQNSVNTKIKKAHQKQCRKTWICGICGKGGFRNINIYCSHVNNCKNSIM